MKAGDGQIARTYRGIDCEVVGGRNLCRRFIKVIITLKEFVIIVLNI